MFGFNPQRELLDHESMVWMIDVFDWAFSSFSHYRLADDKVLIFPNNDHFPGRESSLEGMAALIFSQVKTYAGISSLACDLQNEHGISHVDSQKSGDVAVPADTDNEKKHCVLFIKNLTKTLPRICILVRITWNPCGWPIPLKIRNLSRIVN